MAGLDYQAPNLKSEGIIRPYRCVVIGATDFSGVEANANEHVLGVTNGTTRAHDDTTQHAISGDVIRLQGMGLIQIEVEGAITIGLQLKSDADGKGVPVLLVGTVNQLAFATALEVGADGEIIWALWRPEVIRPALV